MECKRVYGKDFNDAFEKAKKRFGSDIYLVSQGTVVVGDIEKHEVIVGLEKSVIKEGEPNDNRDTIRDYFYGKSAEEDVIEDYPSLERKGDRIKKEPIAETEDFSDISLEKQEIIKELDNLKDEIKKNNINLRDEILKVASGMAFYKNPLDYKIIKSFMGYGFSYSYLKNILSLDSSKTEKEKVKFLVAKIKSAINITEKAPTEKGIHVLTGPPGVGKTTTLAKLAKIAIDKYGKNKVVLITTDNYRIGAVNQLKTYSNLLEVKSYSAKSMAEIEGIVKKGNFEVALIDTSGVSHTEKGIKDKLISFSGMNFDVKTHIVLPSNIKEDIASKVIDSFYCDNCSSVILTKVDESSSIGGILEKVIERKIPFSYATSGQTVPSDISRVDVAQLLKLTFKEKREVVNEEVNLNSLDLGV